jgi:hypothetical protein
MRKLRGWGMAATLALGLAAHTVAAAGDDDPAQQKPPTRSWWSRLWGGGGGPPETPLGIIETENTKVLEKSKAAEDAMKAAEAREQQRAARAKDDYLRRNRVLDRLMQFALESDDKALLRKVETLNDRAWSVYLSRSGQKNTPAVAHQETGNKIAEERGEQP